MQVIFKLAQGAWLCTVEAFRGGARARSDSLRSMNRATNTGQVGMLHATLARVRSPEVSFAWWDRY